MDLWLRLTDGFFEETFFPIYTGPLLEFEFETIDPGGFGSSRLSIPIKDIFNVSGSSANFLNHYAVVHDKYGRVVYEGRVVDYSNDNKMAELSLSGLYSLGEDITSGLIYPITTAKSISEIISDAADLVTYWSNIREDILTTTTDVTPQDFTGEVKVTESIEAVLKYGTDDAEPNPLHFGIWGNRKPWLKAIKTSEDNPDWILDENSIKEGSGYYQSSSMLDIFNKIQIVYNDQYIGQTFTDWYEDAFSQNIYGVREGTMNIGDSSEALAGLIGELAIKYFSYPSGLSKLGVSGFVRNFEHGRYELPYMIRAGDYVRLSGVSQEFLKKEYGLFNPYFTSFIVSRTHYDKNTNTLELEFSKRAKAMDILLSRLGAGSASIR